MIEMFDASVGCGDEGRMFHELRGEERLLARELLGDAIRTALETELDRRK